MFVNKPVDISTPEKWLEEYILREREAVECPCGICEKEAAKLREPLLALLTAHFPEVPKTI